MKLDLIPDLPPRAKKAIAGRFGDTIEALGGLTLADVARLSGVGDAALDALLAAGWVPKSASADFVASQQESEEPRDERHSPDDVNAATVRSLEACLHKNILARLAETFLLKIAERQALTPQAVAYAWEAALAFVQESRRAAGAEVVLFDDLRVRLHGADFLVKTRIPAGEEVPEGARRVLLVPVEVR